jgi:cysteinyl-tRNA synthetase
LSRLHDLVHEINLTHESGKFADRDQLQAALAAGGHIMGLLESEPEDWLKGAQASDRILIDQLVADRIQARNSRDFAKADQIRARLLGLGILLEDGPSGTTWRRG